MGAPTSGTLHHAANTDMHQAYFAIDDFLMEHWGVKAGRFEVNLGNERVFGPVGWHNVGRSWEGIDTWYARSNARIDGFWLKALERDDPQDNRDFDVFGLHADLSEYGVQLSVFFENDAKLAALGGGPGSLERIDVVGYAKRAYDRIDVETNLVAQMGTQERTLDTNVGLDQDISAYLATLELGARVGSKSRVAAGIDLASGDDDPADNELETYDNLYYTGHKFRGAMDYFVPSNPAGLLDLMVRASTQPRDGWNLRGDFHVFQTAVEYGDFEGTDTKDVGSEIDLGLSTTRVQGAQVEVGASLFLPSESFAGMKDPDPGHWFYAMVTAGF